MSLPTIVVHGGSGTIPQSLHNPDVAQKYRTALQEALDSGFDLLSKDGSALDAVTQAVQNLEDCPIFNAGKGSAFTAKGTHQMDAAIMEGLELEAGAMAGVEGIKNPVLLARHILERSPYVFLSSDDAAAFAREYGFEFRPDSYFYTKQRYEQWQQVKGSEDVKPDHSSGGPPFGTVGAAAVDSSGTVAAATSTGGMTNKAWGRIGDSPLIGAGTYANNQSCAVSCTGYGEYFIRRVAAHDVSCRMKYKNLPLDQAAGETLKSIKELGGTGGLIAVDAQGNIALPFNTEGMYRGMKNNQKSVTKIY